MIERQLKRGSGFEYGKFRIYEEYNKNPTQREFAAFLKNEYGEGGFGGYGNDEQWHDAKGLKMALRGENGEYLQQAFLKWEEVAVKIADLIDDGLYFSDEDKTEYEQYKGRQSALQREREETERKKTALLNSIIVGTPHERKQRIADEYAKTTDRADFVACLIKEYGTSVEASEFYRAKFDIMAVWITEYDSAGNTADRFNLSWNEFADRVCALIEN